ncbi:MAG TPA: SPASM domain-containing protein [Candidatus Omnitrophota bacterium]|nr:SPASM domain-containing protein [Candidatus Omnitrophota bacterium]HPT06938.1 SPASM domain-containing protein [Candidatus Omnitrophota bacterium]
MNNGAYSTCAIGQGRVSPRERACHCTQLFVTHHGEVFPCCLRWAVPDMKIGHINDPDLLDRIKEYSRSCNCEKFNLRKAYPHEDIAIQELTIELSLQCQGQCALCCVRAPEWKGSFDLYDSLMKLILLLKPRRILVQGGEVLIQEKSLQWLEAVKRDYSPVEISCVTNGNVPVSMIPRVEQIFDELKVSFLAFEPETYERITCLDLRNAVAFVENLSRRKRMRLLLKYLVTPLGIHEAGLFLEWAIAVCPEYIFLEDAQTTAYINLETQDRFWNKISSRTGQRVKSVLRANKERLLRSSTTVRFSTDTLRVLGLSQDWEALIEELGLRDKLLIY